MINNDEQIKVYCFLLSSIGYYVGFYNSNIIGILKDYNIIESDSFIQDNQTIKDDNYFQTNYSLIKVGDQYATTLNHTYNYYIVKNDEIEFINYNIGSFFNDTNKNVYLYLDSIRENPKKSFGDDDRLLYVLKYLQPSGFSKFSISVDKEYLSSIKYIETDAVKQCKSKKSSEKYIVYKNNYDLDNATVHLHNKDSIIEISLIDLFSNYEITDYNCEKFDYSVQKKLLNSLEEI